MNLTIELGIGAFTVKGNILYFKLPPYEYFKATALLEVLEHPRITCLASLCQTGLFSSDSRNESFISMFRYLLAGGYYIELEMGDFSYYE